MWLVFALRFIGLLSLSSGGMDWQMDNRVTDFSPSQRENILITKCLTQTGTIRGHRNIRMCNRLRAEATLMHDKSRKTQNRRSAEHIKFQYLSKIVDMRNDYLSESVATSRDEMFSLVAPCAKFVPSVNRKWKRFMKKRTELPHTKGFTFFPELNRWDGDVLNVVFKRPIFDTRKYFSHLPIAVDLVFYRIPPIQIDEQFGAYSVLVNKMSGHLSNRSSSMVHLSNQSSCATSDGFMMVLSLDLNISMRWFFQEDSPLHLTVQVTTVQQLFADPSLSPQVTNVIRQALAIRFSFQAPNGSKVEALQQLRNLLFPGQERLRYRRSLVSRSKRNSKKVVDTRRCHLASYQINFRRDIQWQLPEMRFDYPKPAEIRECSGICDWVSLHYLNATQHAFIMKEQEENRRNPPVPPTVCCAPVNYRSLMVYAIDSNQTVKDFEKTSIVVTGCGCL